MITLKVEKQEDNQFSVEVDNGVTVLHITTSSPQRTIVRELRDNGIVGKRGRTAGTKNKPKIVEDGLPF